MLSVELDWIVGCLEDDGGRQDWDHILGLCGWGMKWQVGKASRGALGGFGQAEDSARGYGYLTDLDVHPYSALCMMHFLDKDEIWWNIHLPFHNKNDAF